MFPGEVIGKENSLPAHFDDRHISERSELPTMRKCAGSI
jgi:hypothetical protein